MTMHAIHDCRCAFSSNPTSYLYECAVNLDCAFSLGGVENLVLALVPVELDFVPGCKDGTSEPRQVRHLAVEDHRLRSVSTNHFVPSVFLAVTRMVWEGGGVNELTATLL